MFQTVCVDVNPFNWIVQENMLETIYYLGENITSFDIRVLDDAGNIVDLDIIIEFQCYFEPPLAHKKKSQRYFFLLYQHSTPSYGGIIHTSIGLHVISLAIYALRLSIKWIVIIFNLATVIYAQRIF